MNEQGFTYDEEKMMMIFTADAKWHIRVAYSEGRVWYAARDIASMLGYKDSSKAIFRVSREVRMLQVPQVSAHKVGCTVCKCITKESVYKFINQQRADPEVRTWIRNVVVPQAERQFADIERKTTESVLTSIPEFKPP
ncbi:MAG: hypothetical protein LBL73_05390, partial [Synergistaceae bacterium]|nr:hypothetical protein [Synergistaceae bacterium]